MDFEVTEYKHCTILKGNGRIDSYTAPDVEGALSKLIEKDQFNIIFNMVDIDFVSSAGWWALIRTQKEVGKLNRGELVLVNLDKRIRESMDLVGISPYFKVYDDLTDAVGYY